jgi:2-hydroxychromene-2-carboxylate isomerase
MSSSIDPPQPAGTGLLRAPTKQGLSIRFYYDVISPYAYLASTQLPALAARHGCELAPTPVLFAGLLAATGGKGPAEIPAKRAYMFRDIVRLARSLGVALAPPASHPFNPLLALRVGCCVADGAAAWRLVEALFAATWARGMRVDDPQRVAAIAAEAGLDGEALVRAAGSDAAKAQLRANTDTAIAAGAFGVPTMIAGDELFWGVDSLPLLERFLSGERAFDDQAIESWRHVQPSAVRPGASS